jgi:hypothetical protein
MGDRDPMLEIKISLFVTEQSTPWMRQTELRTT